MSAQDRERREELAHGGLVSRSGDMVTLGDGSRWWLNGEPWARNEADALIVQDRLTNRLDIRGRVRQT